MATSRPSFPSVARYDFAHPAFADFGSYAVMSDGPRLWTVLRARHFRVRPSKVHASVSEGRPGRRSELGANYIPNADRGLSNISTET